MQNHRARLFVSETLPSRSRHSRSVICAPAQLDMELPLFTHLFSSGCTLSFSSTTKSEKGAGRVLRSSLKPEYHILSLRLLLLGDPILLTTYSISTTTSTSTAGFPSAYILVFNYCVHAGHRPKEVSLEVPRVFDNEVASGGATGVLENGGDGGKIAFEMGEAKQEKRFASKGQRFLSSNFRRHGRGER